MRESSRDFFSGYIRHTRCGPYIGSGQEEEKEEEEEKNKEYIAAAARIGRPNMELLYLSTFLRSASSRKRRLGFSPRYMMHHNILARHGVKPVRT